MMKMKQHRFSSLFLSILGTGLLLLLALSACGPTVNSPPVQQVVTVNPSFQEQLSPAPTETAYRCGAWSSTNAPNADSTITIYARLTKNAEAVSGTPAQAVVNFQSGSQSLNQQPVSDVGGYVSFTLPLEGRQPNLVPATVDVTFTVDAMQVSCQAFFAPE